MPQNELAILEQYRKAESIVEQQPLEALAISQEALAQATQNDVHPDYTRALTSVIVSAKRRKKLETPQSLTETLTDALREPRRYHAPSFFGQARINEELGLVLRLQGADRKSVDLYGQAADALQLASSQYADALENLTNEIETAWNIEGRLIRANQVTAATFAEAEPITTNPKDLHRYLAEGVPAANRAIARRTKRGEGMTSGLLDAYHTLGVVHTIGASPSPEGRRHFIAANEAFESAHTIAEKISAPAVAAIMHLRFAYLHLKFESERAVIVRHFHAFMDNTEIIDPSAITQLETRITPVATFLGGVALAEAKTLYQR